MKTKTKLIVGILLVLLLLLGIMPMSALAVAVPPEETPAETVWVGGVALNEGQYVMNGSTTAVTGELDWNESGFAFYSSDGTLILSDYEYEGTGYTHDTSEKSVIYSEGMLNVILFGKSSIKNTADTDIWTANGIRVKGNLSINGPGAITINAPYAICGDAFIELAYGKILIPDAVIAIEAGGDFIVSNGYVELHSTQPILSEASFINGGSFLAIAEQGVFQAAPTISVGADEDYSWYICTDVEGTNQVAYIPENITQYKYFAVLPPTLIEIDSISVSDVEVPEVGDSLIELSLYEATYGETYDLDSWGLEVYMGGRWVEAEGLREVTEGLKYRFILWICPEDGYNISADISGDDISLNGGQVTEFKINEYPDYNELEIYYEFHYGELIDPLIGSIEISGLTLPAAGQTAYSWPFHPDMLTFGGNYDFFDCRMEEYNGTEWVLTESDKILAEVRYRFVIVLCADEGYFFSPELTSDDVTIGEYNAVLVEIDPTGKYAVVGAEFYYDEAPPAGYGIFIADKDESGATVGVEINEENRADVLGDGTVSYDPTTKTLTLNGYKYEGEGFLFGSDSYYGICVLEAFDDLTLVLAGENVITLTESAARMMRDPYYTGIELWNGNMTIKGDGSLAISAPHDGICVYGGEDERGALEIKGGSITIEGDDDGIYTDTSFKMTGGSLTVGATYGIYTHAFEMNGGSITVNAVADYAPGAICAYESFLMNGGTITASATGENAYTIYLEGDFTMNGGSLKLSADCDGIILWEDSAIVVSGGTLEISTKEAGHAFIRVTESDGAVSIVPTVTGDYSMTASVNEDGSGAVIYDEDAHETYKYVKIAFVTKYGIIIADKDESGATVGVEITSENCTDVLGDGTVSYDPTTNTLTLNNYVYNGEGALVDDGGYMAIMADIPAEGLTIVLVGANSITVSGRYSAGMIFFGEGDLTVKGNGSLSINSIMYGITLQSDSGKLTTENAKLNITTSGAMAIGIQATDFVMNSGDLKITASMIGIGTSNEEGICINDGSAEISSPLGGYAFIYLDFEHETYNPIKPDLSGYVGAYKMTAGVNQDGSDATDFNEAYLSSYKYVKIAHAHTHGTTWENDADNHWNACACGDKANLAAHADGNGDGKCDTCERQMSVTPSNPNNPGNAPEDPADDKGGLGAGAIVAIVIGSVLVAGLGGFALFWFVIKKKSFADLIAIFKKK